MALSDGNADYEKAEKLCKPSVLSMRLKVTFFPFPFHLALPSKSIARGDLGFPLIQLIEAFTLVRQADWETATPLYERAAASYRVGHQHMFPHRNIRAENLY